MKPNCMNSEGTTSFYKFLCDHDFTSQLRLPRQFVKNHGKNWPGKAKLLADQSGDSWIVRIEQIGNDRFFTDGWLKFARNADLKSWEFLVFNFVGNSTFKVSVYGTDGCQKELYSCPRSHKRAVHSTTEIEDELDTDQTAGSGDEESWSFDKKLTKDHTSELDIPRGFAMDTGIDRNKKLKLRGAKGKEWPIYVTTKKSGKIVITAGWNEFLTGNNVVVGSTVSFKFISSSSNIIEAKVLKKGSSGELFSCAKRGRGRPPKLIPN